MTQRDTFIDELFKIAKEGLLLGVYIPGVDAGAFIFISIPTSVILPIVFTGKNFVFK